MHTRNRLGSALVLSVPTLLLGASPWALAQTPDFSGVYQAGRADPPCGFLDFEPSDVCPITDVALEREATVTHFDDPGLRCEADALARLFTRLPRPVEIVQRDDRIEIHYEYFGIERVIHLGADSEPPADTVHTLHGYSVGWWEGETLVVETTHLTENLFTLPNSEQLRTVERYQRTEEGNLTLDVEIDDPLFYERPYSLQRAVFQPLQDYELDEWECTNQDVLFREDERDWDSFFNQ